MLLIFPCLRKWGKLTLEMSDLNASVSIPCGTDMTAVFL
jgi:hypothetical protein